MSKKYDLSERLEGFAAEIILLLNKKTSSFSGEYLAKQLIGSSCSSALNYGEALGIGIDRDRTHKLRICLEELRESLRNLNIQSKGSLLP